MNERAIRRATSSLRLIFWGGFLCMFEFGFSRTTNGFGFKFDLLDDAVGTTLIAIGVFRLHVPNRYAIVMRFAQIASVLAVLNAIRDHFIWPLPPQMDFALRLLGFLTLAAIVAVSIAMHWFCDEAGFLRPSRSWSITAVLSFLCLLPFAGPQIAVGLMNVSGTELNLRFGLSGPLLLPLFAVHWAVSASRMKRAAEATLVATHSGEQPEVGPVAQHDGEDAFCNACGHPFSTTERSCRGCGAARRQL